MGAPVDSPIGDERVPSSLRLTSILMAFFLVLLLAMTGMVFALVTHIFNRFTPSVRSDLEWKATSGARELSQTAQTGIVLGDRALLDAATAEYRRDGDVRAIVVTDAAGTPIFSWGSPPEPPSSLMAGQEGALRRMHDYLVAWQPSVIEGNRVGRVGVVISMERLREGDRLRRTILASAGVGAVIALIISLFFVNFYLGPPMKLTERALANLRELAATLEKRVADRTADLEEANQRLQENVELLHSTQRQLVEASRKTGAAEVATAVLHNVGNVLNSVNISAGLAIDAVRGSKLEGLGRAAALLREHEGDLAVFVTGDERGRRLPLYLTRLAEVLADEQRRIEQELHSLQKNVDHIKVIVSMQQTHAKVGGIVEEVCVEDLVEDALKMNLVSYDKHGLKVVRDFQKVEKVRIDRHKLFQIVMNLLSNARHAVKDLPGEKRLVVAVRPVESGVMVVVEDNGVGISSENMTRIFNLGFTTKKDGHGFGLHSSALAASEMGGRLEVHSDGPGHGARFSIVLPLVPAGEEQDAPRAAAARS